MGEPKFTKYKWVIEADEDAPRGVRGIRCTGTMIEDADGEDTVVICDTCGEIA